MNMSEGMMAVVHGLPNGAGLGVSLLEGNKLYMPHIEEDRRHRNAIVSHPKQEIPGQPSPAHHVQRSTTAQSASTDVCRDLRGQGVHCHSGAQAVDGRYASVYQMSHCHVHPTSPPVETTEFPPQRSELYPGRGNFVVGGLGSGESAYSPAKIAVTYKGGLNWPDRGAVFSPRPSRDSREPDAFANSLRKYPNMSPERSSEMVERLTHVTQMKNAGSPAKVSPSRPETSFNQGYDRRSCITATLRSQRGYEPDMASRAKIPDESPTRDADNKPDFEAAEVKRALFGKHYDVRCFRDTARRAKEPGKNVNYATNSVHMETQAEIPMVSIQVATLPREHPSTRNVAVSLSPSSFLSDTQRLHSKSEIKFTCSCKSIQTLEPIGLNLQIRKSVQTCISSIDITKKIKTSRKSRSQEEIKITDELEEELLQLIKDLSVRPELDTEFGLRNGLLRKLRKIHSLDRSDRVKMTYGRCIRDHLYSQIDFKNFTRELSNELISKIKRRNIFASSYSNSKNVFRAELCPFKNSFEENYVDELIKEWLEDIPIKPLDYLGRQVQKEQVLQTVTDKIKHLVMTKVQQDCYSLLKPDIFDIIEDIPIEINARHKIYFLNKIVTNLVNKIENLCTVNATDRKKWKKAIDLDEPPNNNLQQESFVCKYIQPTEEELKQFVKNEIKKFSSKFRLNICPNTEKEIQVELIDILIDSMEAIRYGNVDQIKEEIMVLLSDLIVISQYEGIYFVNNLICNLKSSFKESLPDNTIPQTFVVQQNTLQNASIQTQNNTTDFSTEEVTGKDLHNNLDSYTNLIVQQINEWMANIRGLSGIDAGRKEVVAHDLAEDVVDRCKYLQLNPSRKGADADELEHLKYQIFKSVNKLVGDDNLETMERASELMQRIQNVSVPTLTKTSQNDPTIRHKCCTTISGDPMCNCCNGQTQTKNLTDITEGSNDKTVGTPKITSYTETDMPSKTQPDGTSTNMMGYLKESSTNTIYSDPADIASEPGSSKVLSNLPAISKVSNGKQFKRQNIIQSSPGAILDDPLRKYCTGQTQTINFSNMTDENLDKTVTISKRNSYTETDIPSKPRLWGNSMNMMNHPKGTSTNRRFSTPADSLLGTMTPNTILTPVTVAVAETSYDYVNKWNTSTRHSSAGRATTVYQSIVLAPTATIKQLNEDYDKYLLNWVQLIPIQSSNDEEEALAQNMRQGIYNGVWKALTKLKMNPTNLDNPFYYQDVLDDELEELLSLLPENTELANKKQELKSQLIEKTIQMNAQIINTAASSSYKQQLVDNVANNLPRTDFSGPDIAKVCEEIHRINLAETFIMYTMYREDDKVKANVYKKKLMKHVQEFIDDLKQNLGKEITDIDIGNYRDQIINALYKVPLPNDETIREEADEILLGLEIEQWFSDLPLYPASDHLETLCRMRYRDSLAKKVHEMEKQNNLADCEDELRHEIIKFMEKLPLRPGATENTQFMVEELVNRLKNRPKDILAGSGGRRKSVNFVDGHTYDEFSRDMQLCSSFSDEPGAKRAQINEDSYLIVGGERANASYPHGSQYVQKRQSDTPQTEQQWFSMEEGTIPSAMLSGPRQASARQMDQNQGFPTGPLPSGGQTINPSQVSTSSQTPIPALTIRETTNDQPQDYSFQKPFAQARMRRRGDVTEDPQTSRIPDAYTSENFPGQGTIPGRSPGFSSSFPESSQRASRSPTSMPAGTTGYAPESLTRTYETGRGPSPPPEPEGMSQYGERPYTQTPSDFYREPVGFSTPHQNISGHRESRAKKRTRDVERERREAARRRIDLEDSDESDKEEVRCRCMERVWRCRKKRPQFCPCDEDFIMDFPSCCPMRFPYGYYF